MPFDLPTLRRDLRPFRLHWFPRLRSTNDHAAVLRKRDELFAPAVVLTGHQLAGRGRGSNTWWSGKGSLTVTFVLAADEHLAPHHVPLLAGLAVRAAAAELAGTDDIQLKWPNDLLHDGRKLAGLLCERVHGADLIGVGLNVDIDPADIPPKLRPRVTGLNLISNRAIGLTAAVTAVARHVHRLLANRDEQSFAAAVREYDRHHALVGRNVSVTGGDQIVTGICEGLDPTGRLLVRDRRTTHRVISGHVELVPTG
jgi:BirA family biotin operon repressor/biotin-[acetyl-CoA-carboxylase] ligase